MAQNQRLEELSDKVRKGIPVSFIEALEVINYQEKLKANKPKLKNKISDFFKRVLNN